MSERPWHFVSCEFPPAAGGVADYTAALTRGLVAAGEEVHVWAPGVTLDAARSVVTHPLPTGFGPRGLAQLARGLIPLRDARVFVQYVPTAFGWRGANAPLAALLERVRGELWLMLHEVALFPDPGAPLRHVAVGRITQAMGRRLITRADRVFASTSAWGRYVDRIGGRGASLDVLPIPSNLPTEVATAASERLRDGWRSPVVGHFGTYGPLVADPLREALCSLDRRGDGGTLVLLGRQGARFAVDLRADARWSGTWSIVAPGELPSERVAEHLAACDVLLQPYPDGVTTRRTTVMAGLALGRPVVTNAGALTEALWSETGAVGIVSSSDELSSTVLALLADDARRAALGARAREEYRRSFSMERTISHLLALAGGRP